MENILINMGEKGKFPDDLNDLSLSYIAEKAEKKLKKDSNYMRILQIENASLLLSDGDLTVAEQFKLIEEFEGGKNTLLSTIDGITVWDHLEDSLTVANFFESI